ncbi:techylectin-5A-like [Pollicipes pollicipes]|uniref:techylectin-5A-like n=1 Tax=Pollicipes pollicipes TaxID=41117 RepID=UPI001884F999|nr:techylectin-5A-like [Pollicipes pollicipes]
MDMEDTSWAAVSARWSAGVPPLPRDGVPAPVWLDGVKTTLESQVTEVQSRLDGVEKRLGSQIAEVQSRLDGVEKRLGSQIAEVQSRLDGPQAQHRTPRDCSDLPAGSTSGVHLVRPGLRHPVPVYCDLDTDGGNWTVIQRRADIQPRRDFYLGWEAYKWGFGGLGAEYWWGNEHVWRMTSLLDRQFELRVDLEDFDGETRHALYQGFTISSEADGYRLTVTNYTGDAGDGLGEHSSHRFSTKDRDHDGSSGKCAVTYKGAWWYTSCHSSNLNGPYLAGNHTSYADGVDWRPWRGYHYSLKTVVMKVRPSNGA